MRSSTRPSRLLSIDIDLENSRLGFRGKWLPLSVKRSERTTFGLTVNPDQEVILRVPLTAGDESIDRFLDRKENWISRQLTHFEQFQPKTPERRYISGETHYYLGKPYRLRINHCPRWAIKPGRYFIVIETPRPDRSDLIREHFQAWLKEQSHEVFNEIHSRLEHEFSGKLGYWLPEPNIRHYRSIWAQYDSQAGTYTLNYRLVQASVASIEYVILHEVCHRKYPVHNKRFYNLLDTFMPDRVQRKMELEKMMV
ncbi:MAG: M48 family metallopeptidase [Chitinophagaceae bacterium]|nr:M48 family metallopeptidase [Chitinophagaceae bacterium]